MGMRESRRGNGKCPLTVVCPSRISLFRYTIGNDSELPGERLSICIDVEGSGLDGAVRGGGGGGKERSASDDEVNRHRIAGGEKLASLHQCQH